MPGSITSSGNSSSSLAVTVAVVDGDPQTLRYARDTLTDAGYAPMVTGDAEKLPHLIQTEQPQLILLDLILPGGYPGH